MYVTLTKIKGNSETAQAIGDLCDHDLLIWGQKCYFIYIFMDTKH